MLRPIFASGASGRWLAVAMLSALALAGCPKQELAPLGPCTVSSVSQRVDQVGAAEVDLLFVIDNSGSMATEQVRISELLPRLVQVLTTGDRYAGQTPPEGAEGQRFFTPVSSLHLGVVDTNMGGLDAVPDPIPAGFGALPSCLGLGDDGKLLDTTQVAAEGVYAETDNEFGGFRTGEEILPPAPECGEVAAPRYQQFNVGEEPSAEEVAASFRCVSRVGVRGCPYEMQLDAMLKAVTRSDSELEFFDDTKGHGDPKGYNRGFVREGAILAVVIVSDEEDCSVNPDGRILVSSGEEAAQRFGPPEQINLRCGRFGASEGLVWPVERYVDGLRALKEDNPDRIVFAAIVGMPPNLVGQPLEQVLAHPAMQFREGQLFQPQPACQRGAFGGRPEEAYPGRRFLQVAQGFGSDAVVYSICADDYAPALERLIDRIASKLGSECLPRQLNPDANGLVQCDVYELLAPGEDDCSEARGHVGEPQTRTVRNGASYERRRMCRMAQVPVQRGQPEAGAVGWFYDDFTEALRTKCAAGEQQQIQFTFGDLPEGAGATFECFQPVARVDRLARGLEAVNIRCDGNNAMCAARSDDGFRLFCAGETCQASCTADPDCPPGWVCGTARGEGEGPQFCQQPTCLSDNTVSIEE